MLRIWNDDQSLERSEESPFKIRSIRFHLLAVVLAYRLSHFCIGRGESPPA